MTDKIIDGGPAFPQNDLSAYGMGPIDGGMRGMSLRDYVAIHAPITVEDVTKAIGFDTFDALSTDRQSGWFFERMAKLRYQYADAMLAARGES